MIVGFDAVRALRNATGLGNYSRHLLGDLHRADPAMRCVLYSPRPPRPAYAGLPEALGARWTGPPALLRYGPGRILWRTIRLGHAAARDGVALYHGLTHEIPRDLPATGIPSVVTFHDLIYHRHPEWFGAIDRRSYAFRYRWSAEHATAIIAVSDATACDLVECYGIPRTRIAVIPPSRNARFAEPVDAATRTATLDRYGLPPTFLFVLGTLEPRKNQRAAIAALAKLAPAATPPLLLVGPDGGSRAALERQAAALGVADRVHIRDVVDPADLPALMQSAALFLYPSLAEGFGMPIVEALSAGTPVITSGCGCFPEAGGSGSLYVPAEDADALAAAIRRVLDDAALADRMRAAGRDHARRFDGSALAPRVLAVYDAVIAGRAIPTGDS